MKKVCANLPDHWTQKNQRDFKHREHSWIKFLLLLFLATSLCSATTLTQISTLGNIGRAIGIDKVGNHVYLADDRVGLRVVNVSDPKNPTLLATLPTVGYANDLQVQSNICYLAAFQDGLKIIDVQNPSAPVQIGAYKGYNARDVVVSGQYAYVAARYTSGMQVLDVSTPSAPVRVGGIGSSSYAGNVFVNGNLAYLTDGQNVCVINVSNPASPTLVAKVANPNEAMDVFAVGRYLYVTSGNAGLRIFDVTTPSQPVLVGALPSQFAYGVKVVDGYAFVTDSYQGLLVVDVSNPATPTVVAQQKTPDYANRVFVDLPYVYLADNYSGLIVYLLKEDKPVVTNQPVSSTVNAHDTATFSVGAIGEDPLNYQWKFYGADIEGATNSTLIVSNVTPDKLGSYYVTITNAYGSVNSAVAMLTMSPYLQVPFAGATNNYGDSTTLSVEASGSGPLSYQWYQDGNPIEGATNQSWTLDSLNFNNGGAYTVVVSSPYGSVTNAIQSVVVLPTRPFATVSLEWNLSQQNERFVTGNISTTAPPARVVLTAKKLLKILAQYAYLKGNWPSNSFPNNSALALVNDTFFVIHGKVPLLNVSDILSLEYGEPQVTFGSRNLDTGLASPIAKANRLAVIEFNDTAIDGGSQLHLYLYGVCKKTIKDTPPANGTYTEILEYEIPTLVGDGYYQGVPLTVTGTLSAHGQAKKEYRKIRFLDVFNG